MPLQLPSSMNECVYFTRRSAGEGRIIAWVLKNDCPKCKKSVMGKPKDEKGKVKIRAKEYLCENCLYKVPLQEYEDSLTTNIQYVCSHCRHQGEIQIPFQRKKVKIFDEEEAKSKTVNVLRFQCQKCRQNIDITKKMK